MSPMSIALAESAAAIVIPVPVAAFVASFRLALALPQ